VGHPFGLLDLGPLGSQGAVVRLGGTELAAGGTGLLVGELVGLLLQQQLQGSFGQPLGGDGSDLLEGAEVHIKAGTVVAEGPSGHDFAPLGGQGSELVEFLSGESGSGHGSSCLEVAAIVTGAFPLP
jgi:hypothetical protein